jgi:hypothetical protein
MSLLSRASQRSPISASSLNDWPEHTANQADSAAVQAMPALTAVSFVAGPIERDDWRTLCLPNVTKFDDNFGVHAPDELKLVHAALPRVENLNIMMLWPADAPILSEFAFLRELDIGSEFDVGGDFPPEDIAKNCAALGALTQLTRFTLLSRHTLGEAFDVTPVLRNSANLAHLELDDPFASAAFLSSDDVQRLERLLLVRRHVCEEQLSLLDLCDGLHTLDLRFCHITQAAFEDIVERFDCPADDLCEVHRTHFQEHGHYLGACAVASAEEVDHRRRAALEHR